MLGRISARTGVRLNNAEASEGDGAPGIAKSISRFWKRTPRPTTPAETLEEEAAPNRFEPVRLSQVETPGGWTLFATRESSTRQTPTLKFSRPGEATAELPVVEKERKPRAGAGRVFDRALLALEVVGALVVAWLAFQYVYTVYVDTGTHRLSGTGGNALVVPQLSKATPTSTRYAEVAPPLTGEGSGAEAATPTRFAEVVPPMTGDGSSEGTPLPKATATTAPTPTATVEPQLLLPNRLRIPVMFLDSPVHEVEINMGTWEVSPMDIGHHMGTGNPGETGNVVLAGHRDINSALFRELDRLKPGDEVFVSNSLGEYRYIVQEAFEVSPNEAWVMDPTDDKRVTLITCTPIGLATRRLIVVALLDEN